ncbi:TPA: hypothetical protein ACP61A_004347 [Escherichia coli]
MATVHNFSKLLEGNNASAAAIEAKKNIIHNVISSNAQDSGWGELEVFLVRLCSLFSARCKDVSNALTDVQRTIDHLKDYVQVDSEEAMEDIAQGVFKLYIASEVYRQLGATMSFRVNMEGSTNAKIMLSGQPGESSELKAAELGCEIDISVQDATIFKALAGDLLLGEYTTKNPYVVGNRIEECFDFSSLNSTQIELVKSLACMPVNNVKAIMTTVGRANDALKAVSTHIKENAARDVNPLDLITTFHNMYAEKPPYNLDDFLAVSSPIINGVEKMNRRVTVQQVDAEVRERHSLFDKKIKDTDARIKAVIRLGAEDLKKQAFDLVRDIYVAIKGESAGFDSENWENSLKALGLPRDFRKKFGKCIEACEQCEQYDSFEKAAKLVSGLLASGVKISQEKLKKEQEKDEVQQKHLDKYLSEISKYKKCQTEVCATIEKLKEELNDLAQQKGGKISDIQRIENEIAQIDGRVKHLGLDNENKRSELQSLKHQRTILEEKLSSCQTSERELEEKWCHELSIIQEKMTQRLVQSAEIKANFDNLKTLSDDVLKKAREKRITYPINAFQDILVTGTGRDIDETKLADISMDKITAVLYSATTQQKSIVDLWNKIFHAAHPNIKNRYNTNDFLETIQEEELFEAEELEEGLPSAITQINKKVLPKRFIRINDEKLDIFLKKLSGLSSLEEELSKCSVWDFSKKVQIRKEIESALVSDSFATNRKLVKEKLNMYKQVHNQQITMMRDRLTVLRRKKETIRVLFDTVMSMKRENWNELDFSSLDSDSLDKVGFDSMPKEVQKMTKQMKELYKSNIDSLREKRDEFQNKINRLLGKVLPKFIEYETDSSGIQGINKYRINFLNLEEIESLDTQDKLDIKWVLDVIADTFVKEVEGHQEKNGSYFRKAFEEEINLCKQEGEELNRSLNDLAKEFSTSLNTLDAKIEEAHKSLEVNNSRQELILGIIDNNTANIKELDLSKSEHEKEITTLRKEISSLERNITKTERRVGKNQETDSLIAQKICQLEGNAQDIRETQRNIQGKIDRTNQLLQRVTSISECVKNNDGVQNISDYVKQQVNELETDLKEFKDSQAFLFIAMDLLTKGLLRNWADTGHFVQKTGVEEKEYNGHLFDARIPHNASKEESIKIWKNFDYQTVGSLGSKSEDKVRADSVVANDLFSVNDADNFLDEIQAEHFNRLFENKGNQLITGVYNSLKAFGGGQKPDFRLFQKFIVHRYSAIQNYRSLHRLRNRVAPHTIENAEKKKTAYAQFDDIMKLSEELYKAQMLFGIYMAAVLLDKRTLVMCRKKNLSIDVICAGLRANSFAQIYNDPKKHQKKVDYEFSEMLNQWRMSNGKGEDKGDINLSLLQKISHWMKNKDRREDYEPIVNFLISVIEHQLFFVNSSMKTGNLITRRQPSEFAGLSLHRLLWKGGDNNLTGIDYLFGITDIAGGVRDPDEKMSDLTEYSYFVECRKNWVSDDDDPNFKQQVSQACAAMNLKISGIPTPEVSSAVA